MCLLHPLVPPFCETEASEVDLIYQVLKQAGEISSNKTPPQSQQGHPSMMQQVAASSGATPTVGIQLERGATPSSSGQNLNRLGLRPPSAAPRQTGSSLCVVNPAPCSTSSGLSLIKPFKQYLLMEKPFLIF